MSEKSMIFRLSQKLGTKVKAGTLPALPLGEDPLADWSAHVFVVNRVQYILLCNTRSLYSSVIYGKGITDESEFINRSLESIRSQMEVDGHLAAYTQRIVPACASVRFGKALNRRVTGSMNDMIRHLFWYLSEHFMSPFEAGANLNGGLQSMLGQSKEMPYGKPRDAFKELIGPQS